MTTQGQSKGNDKMVTVLVVDDHNVVRQGIAKLLSTTSNIKVAGEAKSGEEAIDFLRKKSAHVVLMDLKMPGIGGLEATRRILQHNPAQRILILTVVVEDPLPSKILNLGAAGYISKEAGIKEIAQAIATVNVGKRYIMPKIAQDLAIKSATNNSKSPLDLLSDRELQIMIMIAEGLKTQYIADKLCIAAKTAHSYRYRLFKKLGINSDVELTRLAIKHGLVNLSG
jgi:two-component system, NarL family, invasion response regulator UvrY